VPFKQIHKRKLKFNAPGKHIEKAEEMRISAHLAALKQKIAVGVAESGVKGELELVGDGCVVSECPPEVEWWDLVYTVNGSYNSIIDLESKDQEIITNLVQHPVPIQPTFEKVGVVREIMLTKKERKKMRRQRRLEAQADRRDKIQLGLLPPDQPKVKLSNLMRVLGNEAVLDPTAIEARVRTEMKSRVEAGLQHNRVNKLTEEEKKEKRRLKGVEDESGGAVGIVFRISDLSDKRHQFKVDMNAKQLKLSGVAVVYSQFSTVVVEGGPKACKKFKKLMMGRIDWGAGGVECRCVWEGAIEKRSFRGFWMRFEGTEEGARRVFEGVGKEEYWGAARNWVEGSE